MTLLVALAMPLAGCGGDDDVERARQEGARQARLQERQKEQRRKQRELEDKLKDLEEKQRQGGGGGSSGGSTSSGGGTTACGDGLSVGPNTTCAFARVVRAEYERTGRSTFSAYSPVTGRSYVMSCTSGSPHVCTGGNNATVYFP